MILSAEQAIRDVADILYTVPTELDHQAELRDQGMDSVRIMELVERWRTAGVTKIDFITLAEDQRLSNWLTKLEELQSEVADTVG